jgi:hypothetical protein
MPAEQGRRSLHAQWLSLVAATAQRAADLYAGLFYFEKAAEALITMIWRASELLRAPGCFAL